MFVSISLVLQTCALKFVYVNLSAILQVIQTQACKHFHNLCIKNTTHRLLTGLLHGNVLYTGGCKRNRLAAR